MPKQNLQRRSAPAHLGIRIFAKLREAPKGIAKLIKQLVGELAQGVYFVARKFLARRGGERYDEGVTEGMGFADEGTGLCKHSAGRFEFLMESLGHVRPWPLEDFVEDSPKRVGRITWCASRSRRSALPAPSI
jgi:hypothetical protein